MEFGLLLVILWGVGLFYRREHVKFVADMGHLAKDMAGPELPQGADWRITGQDGNGGIFLQRAFNVTDRESFLRYAAPFLFLSAFLMLLQNWAMAGIFGGIVALKWFASKTRLDLKKKRYDVTIFGLRLYGEDVSGGGAEGTASPDGSGASAGVSGRDSSSGAG